MSYIVRLLRVSDGKRVDVEMPGEWNRDTEWMWSEGNYGCDCNRELAFARAEGADADELRSREMECGEGRFEVDAVLTKPSPGEVRTWVRP